MSKDRQNPLINKSHFKKPKAPLGNFDTYLKNQQKEKQRLKRDLQTVVSQEKELYSFIVEKNKIIVELEKSIEERDSEILKSNNDIKELKEKNVKTLQDFSYFKNNFYQLEEQYDKICTLQKQENEDLKAQLHLQQSGENKKIQELSLDCQKLQQQLQDKTQSYLKLNGNLLEIRRNSDKMKQDFEKQQLDFENYKKRVEEENKSCVENSNFKFAELNKILSHKENIIKKCMEDNEKLEKDKNRIIDELNNKISRIERAFSQPTKAVHPMVTLPNDPTNDVKSHNNTEIANDYVAVTRPQIRESVETQYNPSQAPAKTEIAKLDKNLPPQRQYKYKRPSQHPTSIENITSSSSNTNNNKKRRVQPVRQAPATLNLSAPPAIINEFSSTSDDESDGDSIFHQQWRPKNRNDECFVPDTSDTSECFTKPKRAKK